MNYATQNVEPTRRPPMDAGTPSRESEIPNSITALKMDIASLMGSINDLHKRLDPIMRGPTEDQDRNLVPVKYAQTEIGRQLADLDAAVSTIQSIVTEIHNRLEL